MDREERIYKEKLRLTSLFWNLPREDYFGLVGLIDQASFLRVALDDMQKEIAEVGTTDEYQNGTNQSGRKISAVLQSYNQTVKLYEKIISTLMKYIPTNKHYRPPGADESEYLAFRNFMEKEEIDFYLSADFATSLERDKQKALELMAQGN